MKAAFIVWFIKSISKSFYFYILNRKKIRHIHQINGEQVINNLTVHSIHISRVSKVILLKKRLLLLNYNLECQGKHKNIFLDPISWLQCPKNNRWLHFSFVVSFISVRNLIIIDFIKIYLHLQPPWLIENFKRRMERQSVQKLVNSAIKWGKLKCITC